MTKKNFDKLVQIIADNAEKEEITIPMDLAVAIVFEQMKNYRRVYTDHAEYSVYEEW